MKIFANGKDTITAGFRQIRFTGTGRTSATVRNVESRCRGLPLGRTRKGEIRDRVQDYQDECEWVKVERRFSLAKQKCGMGLVTAELKMTAAHVVAMSILLLNLRKILSALLRFLHRWLRLCESQKNWTVIRLFSRH